MKAFISKILCMFFACMFACACFSFGSMNTANAAAFSVTTTSTSAIFEFKISAKGTFYVDCGDGGTLSGTGVSGTTIDHTSDTTTYTYTCTYSTAGVRTIEFDGEATAYATGRSSADAAILFASRTVSSVSGDLSAVFPYLGEEDGQSPVFKQTFSGQTNLTSIASTLFRGYTVASTYMFFGTFWGCTSLTSIPAALFANIESADGTAFGRTFQGCTGLTSLPENLFSNILINETGVFYSTFEGCTGLTSLPGNLFYGITSINAHTFNGTFKDCTGLTSIPASLLSSVSTFDNAQYTFKDMFSGCTGLTSIPDNLFANVTSVYSYMFQSTFAGCTRLTALPENLFANITQAVGGAGFYETFKGCTGLTGYIPTSMFAGLIANGSPGGTNFMYNIFGGSNSLATSCPTGKSVYITGYNSYWGGHVSCVDSSVTVSYSCGSGSGTAPSSTTFTYNSSFTPAANTCTASDGYVFDGWLVGGTNDVKTPGTAFTWTYAGNRTFIAQYVYRPFSVTTTSIAANKSFYFNISAKGTFYVDCGEGGRLSGTGVSGNTITKTNTTDTRYTCTYSTAGVKTIRFGGQATEYNTSYATAAIKFYQSSYATTHQWIASLSGNLSAIFPYLGSGSGQWPTFYGTFSNCTYLTSISGDLFANITGVGQQMFTSTFSGCSRLTSIPGNLFSNITNVPSDASNLFWSTFYGCTSLTSIPANLFSFGGNNVNATPSMFYRTFEQCTGLTSIPENLFSHVTGGADSAFSNTFRYCKFTSVPGNLFSGITTGNTKMFSYTFADNSNLTSISGDLFKFSNDIAGANYMFEGVFYNCAKLAAIPSSLFSNVTGGASQLFYYAFSKCSSLTSLPENLFSKITSAASSMFYRTFQNCTSLTGFIPPSFFAGLIANGSPTASSMMSDVFAGSGLLTACPAGMSKYITGYESSWSSKVSCEPTKYTVTYACGSGSGTAPSAANNVVYNTSFTPATNTCTVPTGYSGFAGWLVSGTSDIKPAGTAFTYTYTENKTFTAQYTPGIYTITLRNYDNSSTHSTIYEKYATGWYSNSGATTTISVATVPTRSGYTFRGFYTAKQSDLTASGGSGTRRITNTGGLPGNTTFSGNTSLYAAWAKNCSAGTGCNCTLTMNDDGTVTYTTGTNTGYTLTSGSGTYAPVCSNSYTCAAGKYLPANSTSCSNCPAGNYCAGGTYTFNTSSAQGITGVCNANTYSTGGASAATCTACNTGYTTSGTAASNHDNANDCKITCTAGNYVASAGAQCTGVGSGYYRATSETISQGSTGTRSACSGLTAPSVTGGTFSSVSPYNATTTCRYVAPDKTKPTNCATITKNTVSYSGSAWGTNFYSVTANAGSYISANGSANPACTACPVGSYTASAGTQTSCTVCGSAEATMGKTTSAAGQTSCNANCSNSSGVYSWTTASWTSGAPANVCKVAGCAKGTAYSSSGNGSCTACATGTYMASENHTSTSCSACSALSGVSPSGGTYTTASTGSTASTACKYTAPSKTITGCKTVTSQAVTYSGTAWPASTYGVTANKGYVIANNNSSSATCTQCTSGYYQATDGSTATSCSACSGLTAPSVTGGTFSSVSPYDANTTCRYVAPDKTKPTNCATITKNTVSYSGSAWGTNFYSVTANAGSYISANGSANPACTQCATGSYTASAGTQTSCSVCGSGTTTSAAGQTSCNATCSNNNAYDHAWATPNWNNNSPTGLCKITSCKAGSYYTSTNSGNTNTCTACAAGNYKSGDGHTSTSCSACSALSGVSPSGGTYTTASTGSTASTACKYTAPSKTITGCKTVTSQAVTYSGTAWPASTYGVTANKGYVIANNNSSSATCTQCTGSTYQATDGSTATSCTSCPVETGILITENMLEQNGITDATGVGTGTMNNRVRIKLSDEIPLSAGTYTVSFGNSSSVRVRGAYLYETAGVESSFSSMASGASFTLTAKRYVRLVFQMSTESNAITVADVVASQPKIVKTSAYVITGTAVTDHDAAADCKITCPAGTYVATSGGSCVPADSGYYAAGGTVAYGSTSSETQCPANYRAGSDSGRETNTTCYLATTAKKYVASAGAGEVDCNAGYYCPGAVKIYYGGTSSSSHPTTGGRTSCPANSYCPAKSSTHTTCSSATSSKYTISSANSTSVKDCKVQCAAGTRVATINAACTTPAGPWVTTAAHYVNYGRISQVTRCMYGYQTAGTAASNHDAITDCTISVGANKYIPAMTLPVRYIKLTSGGSTANSGTYMVEVEAYTSNDATGTNLLAGKGGISGSNMTAATDGSWSRSPYSSGSPEIWDLGAVKNIGSIKFSTYPDGRVFTNFAISVSADNSNWTTILNESSFPTDNVSTAVGEVIKLSGVPTNCASGYNKAAHTLTYGNTSSCSANTISATFDGTTTNTCDYDGTLDVPTPSARTGYYFVGWEPEN